MNRREVYEKLFSAKALFVATLLIIPSVLFNPSTEYRVFQFLFFWLLVFLSGKKTNPIFTILVILFIVAFNLLIPYGRVIFSIGTLKITSGALKAGIHRAVTFEALIMLSKFGVRQDLKLPGSFGSLLADSLRIFSAMTERKNTIKAKTFFSDIDNLLIELSEEELPFQSGQSVQTSRTKPIGCAILVLVVCLSWLTWVGGLV